VTSNEVAGADTYIRTYYYSNQVIILWGTVFRNNANKNSSLSCDVTYHYSYIHTAVEIIDQYKGQEPVSSFLKKFFNQNKKYGSRDRKQLSHLCYFYFRLGKSVKDLPIGERILIGLFLCSDEPNAILKKLKPEWDQKVHLHIKDKLLITHYPLLITQVFPWKEELSEEIDHKKFCESIFIQPDLFLRLRPGHEKEARTKLKKAGIDFKEINSTCIALPNASKVEDILELNKEAVVQDLNSQRTAEFFKSAIQNQKSKAIAWDCCAGSGGKSIMLYDLDPKIELIVSDIRESIIANLKNRFQKAGIKKYESFVIDLTRDSSTEHSIINIQSSIIIADVPCSGSGTWGRTPEQLYYFDEKRIDHYASLQKKIVSNVIPHLTQNGYLVYITCSVFRKENEEVVNFIREKFNLEIIRKELLNGNEKKADTMFAALLKRTL
jgi:16S rRNA (cytosine967-C5)-methyltransferase